MAETEPVKTFYISKWNTFSALTSVDIAAGLKNVLTCLAMGGEPGRGLKQFTG
jgi:hypothetical protein